MVELMSLVVETDTVEFVDDFEIVGLDFDDDAVVENVDFDIDDDFPRVLVHSGFDLDQILGHFEVVRGLVAHLTLI